MDIYTRIKELRKDRKLTQKQLANDIGYTQAAVADWERAKIRPTFETVIVLARFFNVSSDYLLGLEDESGAKIHINNSFIGSNIRSNINFGNNNKNK